MAADFSQPGFSLNESNEFQAAYPSQNADRFEVSVLPSQTYLAQAQAPKFSHVMPEPRVVNSQAVTRSKAVKQPVGSRQVGIVAASFVVALVLLSALFWQTTRVSDDVAVGQENEALLGDDPSRDSVPGLPADSNSIEDFEGFDLSELETGEPAQPPVFVATGELPDRSLMAARSTAFDYVELQDLSMAEISTDPSQNPWLRTGGGAVGRAGLGQKLTKVANFRTWCSFSHFSYNDPIVFPGQEGVAHLHMFMGNTLADHNSTGESLQNSGGSSCDGGPLNRSSYWTPALLDGEGNARIPRFNFVYYKTFDTGNARPALEDVEAFPSGLQFLSSAKSTVEGQETRNIDWWCGPITNNIESKTPHFQSIPDNCPQNLLGMRVRFPFCWNGELKSSDPFTNDHMVFPVGDYEASVCPDSHPRRIPHIEYQMIFRIPAGSDLSQWHLSSDVNPTTGEIADGGSTSHGDWFNGWNEAINESINNDCHRALGECHQGIVQSNGVSLVPHNRPYLNGDQFIPLEELTKLCPGDTDTNSVEISYCSTAGTTG